MYVPYPEMAPLEITQRLMADVLFVSSDINDDVKTVSFPV
jgi:hypothetical protein